jgi:hypothetical protein
MTEVQATTTNAELAELAENEVAFSAVSAGSALYVVIADG